MAPKAMSDEQSLLDNSARRQVGAGIASSSLLKAVSEKGRHKLAGAGRLVVLSAGQTLFDRGDPPDAMYVVISGEVEVRSSLADGREIRFAAQYAGGIVGEMAVLDRQPRSADVVAARRTKLWRIPQSAVLSLLESEPAASLSIIGELARRLRAANESLQVVTLQDLGARLAYFLLNEAGSSGLVSLTQTEVARRISASREKVNRKLHAFAAEGLISFTKSGMHVLNADALTQILAGRA